MKKILAIVMALVLMLSMTALAESEAKSEGVMTYAEYAAAELDSEVTIETYVQAKQSWWNNQATLYTADQEGGYFVYNLACSEEDYAKLVPGTKIKLTGYKMAWAGEVEVDGSDAKFEILEGSYIAQPMDVTALLADESLIDHQNKLVAFKGMTVEACNDKGDAFQYNWDGSGEAGSDSDLYFNASVDGATYTFVIEYYMCDENGVYGDQTAAYQAVQALKVGDKIDMTGFLYWYEGAQPHIASVQPAAEAKGEGVMTYAEYAAAELDSEVTIETYVQAKQSWWNNQATLYTADQEGGYFVYNLACSEEDYAKLVPGTKIKLTGYKMAWAGEVEVDGSDAKFEILEGSYIAQPMDVTALLADESLIDHQNKLVAFKGMTVEACNDKGDAFQYNWDGSGEAGSDSDLYFNASVDGATYTFVIEYYMCDENGVYGDQTAAYQAVQALKVGDKIDMTGFLYWYEGAQPHIASVAAAE